MNEVITLVNDAMKHMKQNKEVTEQDVKQFLTLVDKDGNGSISKDELFEIFKQVIQT